MPTSARTTRSKGDVLRGLAALLLIAGLLVGIPISLIMIGAAPPVPSSVPRFDQIMESLTEPDDGQLLVAAMTWAAWIGWLTLALSIIVEIPAAIHGVPAPRLPALAPQQRLAAALVTTAGLLLTAGPASLALSTAEVDSTARSVDATPDVGNRADAETGAVSPTRVHVVERGDTLWDIAHRYLGDGRQYPELYEASKRTEQPDGRHLTDPDEIDIGWKITIPDRSVGPTDTRSPPAEPQPLPASTPTVGSADSPNQPQQPPRASPENLGAGTGKQPGVPAVPSPSVDDQVDDDSVWDDETMHDLRTLGGIGAVLAAGLLAYIGAQRARQRRHRRPGQRITLLAAEAAETEDALRRIDYSKALEEINRALRTLAARCSISGTTLPRIRYARLIDGQFELYLAEPAKLPAPFLPTANETLWVLDPGGDIFDPDQAGNYPAPFPALVTVGHDSDGGILLVDLEQAGALAIDATEPAETAQIMAALAAELATSPWSDDLRVTTVGAFQDLGEVLERGRIRYVEGTADRIDKLLAEVTARADADRKALTDVGAPSLPAARLAGVAEGSWAPEILFVTVPQTAEQQERLAFLVEEEPRLALAAVTSSGPPLTEWVIRTDQTDRQHATIEPIGLSIAPQRISSEHYPHILDLLRAADLPAGPAEPSKVVDLREERPRADEAQQAEHKNSVTEQGLPFDAPGVEVAVDETRRAPIVAVLGPVEIQHAPPLAEANKRGQLTALAAYLALYPGQSREAVDEALWPGTRVPLTTRNTAMTKLRNWLETDAKGTDYVPRATPDGYRLHPAIRTDWQIFTGFLPSGPATATTADLLAALQLVRDQPFKGVNPRKYLWAERLQQEMISAIADVAEELARRALHVGDHRTALSATMTGLKAEPGSEVLWRHRLRAHHAANDRAALQQAIAQLTALADDLGGDLEDETTELINELSKPTRANVTVTKDGAHK